MDFRRVQNLKEYFANNLISLTTDISVIEQWQGGTSLCLRSILELCPITKI
ncbi:hypothetical protein [Anaerotignum propionicum]|uniref:hypothetical protein n=1 Tax=Anaerotignum propionicum TaxID=28446 RepID=UPI003BEEEBBF